MLYYMLANENFDGAAFTNYFDFCLNQEGFSQSQILVVLSRRDPLDRKLYKELRAKQV